jgi:hypothetical protein
MLFYIPIIITTIFGIGLVFSFYKNARLRFQLDFLRQISQEEQNKNNLLEIQKIEYNDFLLAASCEVSKEL